MLKKYFLVLIFVICLSGFGCSGSSGSGGNLLGGSEAGNPNLPALTRSVTGTLQVNGAAPALVKSLAADCPISFVRFVTTTGDQTDVPVVNCAFEAILDVDLAYILEFYNQDVLWAVASFEPGIGLTAPFFYLGEGNNPLNLGFIIFNSTTASVSLNPYQQNDLDGDGLNDFDDLDDDSDGIADLEEADCNENGIPDDFESGDVCGVSFVVSAPSDRDEDGVPDGVDNCISNANEDQLDNDTDGMGDVCDDDDDNDSFLDDNPQASFLCNSYYISYNYVCDDNCPLVANPDQADDNQNGIGNACE